MQNDMLKNNIAPWQEKGRWYHGVFDCTSHTLDTNKTDIEIINNFTFTTISNWYCLYQASNKYDILDIHRKFKNYTSGSTSGISEFYITSSGVICPAIAQSSSTAGTVEFWIFLLKK